MTDNQQPALHGWCSQCRKDRSICGHPLRGSDAVESQPAAPRREDANWNCYECEWAGHHTWEAQRHANEAGHTVTFGSLTLVPSPRETTRPALRDEASQVALIAAEELHKASDEIERLRTSLERVQRERDTLKRLSEELVAKLDAVSPYLTSQVVFMQAHGQFYDGPNYGEELKALRAALSSPPPTLQEEQ